MFGPATSGCDLPCSQFLSVAGGKPNLVANCAWLSRILSRTFRTSTSGTCTSVTRTLSFSPLVHAIASANPWMTALANGLALTLARGLLHGRFGCLFCSHIGLPMASSDTRPPVPGPSFIAFRSALLRFPLRFAYSGNRLLTRAAPIRPTNGSDQSHDRQGVAFAPYAFLAARRVANLATLMMARSCVPSPIFSFSSQASTRNVMRRPSTCVTSARNRTLIPIGAAAK